MGRVVKRGQTAHSKAGQCKTAPALFGPLQVLDFGLNHANSAVVMATAKLFLHYTAAFPAQHQQARPPPGLRLPILCPVLPAAAFGCCS